MSSGNADLMRSNESTTVATSTYESEAAMPRRSTRPRDYIGARTDWDGRVYRVYAIAYLARIGDPVAGPVYGANGASHHVIWLIVSGFVGANSPPVL